jgi:3-oxoacyl-[acyl-carrier protein] reductase
MDLELGDRVYLVTGASRGLGFATARALVDEGARVVISGRHEEGLRRARAVLGEERCATVRGDNADAATPAALVAEAQERFGRVDGVLISVGGPPPGTVMEIGDDAWRSAFESVFLGAVRTARTVARVAEPGGSIVFVLSTSVRSPIGSLAISNGLRPGLAMVAKSLADELGDRSIRVNGMLPGRFATERMTELESGLDEHARRRAREAIPLGRLGEPHEFGRIAAVLLSPVASYLNGSLVTLDGGASRAL